MSKAKEDKSLPNLKVLQNIHIKGNMFFVGAVLAKTDFDNKSDWQNLCHMEQPRLEETKDKCFIPDRGEPVKGKAKAAKADTLPGA